MDAVTHAAIRRMDSSLHAVAASPVDASRTLAVIVEYRLSEVGRKAALLSGGDGRAHQRFTLAVPVTRLHLVHVAANGVARLKLRPQFTLSADQRIVRSTAGPVYDQPPTIDELLQDAARNHELERIYHGQQTTRHTTRREANQSSLDEIARAFLGDPRRRAVSHPPPTARRCQLTTDRGGIHFDARRDTGVARQVPLEAFRRFQNDLHIRHGRGQSQREQNEAVHAERQRMMRAWIAAEGTPDQRARLAAGVFPMSEWLDVMTEATFQALAPLTVYESNGAICLQAYLRQFPTYVKAVVTPLDLRVSTRLLTTATPLQWDLMQQIRTRIPDAKVQLRERELAWTRDPQAPRHRTITVLVTTRLGPLALRREFVMPETAPLFPAPQKEDACV